MKYDRGDESVPRKLQVLDFKEGTRSVNDSVPDSESLMQLMMPAYVPY